MSYLDTKPSYVHITGGVYSRFDTLGSIDRDFALTLFGLDGWAQLGGLDAVDVIPAGSMTSTPLDGLPFPERVPRES